MKILIDNGHGYETKGKRSPDGKLLEYEYTRKVANALVNKLISAGYDAELVTPEMTDVPISIRCRRVNAWCSRLGTKNVVLVSLHLNAAGSDGTWKSARGWSAHVSLNASSRSKNLADHLFTAANELNIKTRVPKPGQSYWPQNLGICRESWCPAVLTENLFQDNHEDYQWLLTEEGFNAIVTLHYKGIINYIQTHQ